MIIQLKTTLHNAQSTLLQDALGAASLMIMLIVALHLPGFL
jgi:hypothetical protein